MRNQNIAKVLKEYRKRNHLSVNDVSILLEDRSFTAAPKTIYGWESGQANPSADILLTLCDLYNITDILEAFGYDSNENFHVTPSERTIIEAYRAHPEMHEAVSVLLGCRYHAKVLYLPTILLQKKFHIQSSILPERILQQLLNLP